MAFEKEGNTLRLSGGWEISDYMDCVGPQAEKLNAWIEILTYLKSHISPHRITLPNIPEDSESYRFFRTQKTVHGYSITVQREDTTPTIPLPATYDAYFAQLSRANRHELRRKIRKFQKENPNISVTNIPCALMLPTLFDLMKQHAGKQKFLTPQMETFFSRLAHQASIKSYCTKLSVGESPAAVVFTFRFPKTWYIYNSGFDANHFPGAGFYLQAILISQAIKAKTKEYNLLQGNERYKYELGAQDRFVYTITLQ